MDTDRRLRADLTRADAQLAELEQQRARVMAASDGSNADDEHDPEGATIAFEREQLTAVIRQTRQHRSDVVRALAKLDDGSYGSCERCGEPIGSSRLEARPTARTCITCAGTR